MRRRDAAVAFALFGILVASIPAFLGTSRAQAEFGFSTLASTFTDSGGVAGGSLPAGSHPGSWAISLSFDTTGPPGEEHPDGEVRNLRISFPPGMIGTTALLPKCSAADYGADSCPAATRVGTVALLTDELDSLEAPVHLLEPEPGVAVQLGLHVEGGVPVTVDLSISPRPPHNLVAEIANASQGGELFGAVLTLEGVVGGTPFLTLPRNCSSSLAVGFSATSWEVPPRSATGVAPASQTVAGCDSLAYGPELAVNPTTTAAATPSGMDLDLDVPQPGLAAAGGRADADTVAATLALPRGMTLNPPAAAGLTGCTPEELATELPDADPGTGCPPAAKVGVATVITPLFSGPIAGELFLAQPDDPMTAAPGAENPFDSMLSVYLVLRAPERGILLTLPIRIDADQRNGSLTASFPRIPELSLSHLSLRFNSGPRAPLTTPPGCDSHTISYSLMPSSGNPPLRGEVSFPTTSGCDTPFGPDLSAGATAVGAGSAAPLVLELRNDAGAPNLRDLHLTLPPGLSADLTVPTCSEAGAVTAQCAAASRLGYVRIALGTGPEPLWVPAGGEPGADVYLAGPYGGAPFSLVTSVPAKAGPFDLGRMVLHAPLRVDPDTARASVDVSALPQIIDGIPLHYRIIRLVLDRPGFIRNPTSCAPTRVELTAAGIGGASATSFDRFQVSRCAALGFRPRLAVRFSRQLGRNGHPRIDLALNPRTGDASIAAATFDLPPGELLDTRRIRALCRHGLPPERCPAASRIGRAEVRSPLLPMPLRGPIYLRSPGGRYPELLADLRAGEVRLRLHGRTASAPGGRLRIRLGGLPDIPLSGASVTLAGGRRGILANSASLCPRPPRTVALLEGHNGRESRLRPRVQLRGPC